MPDLSPDTSIYSTIAKSSQSGLGSMDLGSLLGAAQRARQLQTQQAISDALKNSIDPNTGQPNASAAISGLVHSPAMLGSDDITHLNAMQHQQAQTRAFNTEQAGKAAAAFYNEALAGTATPEKAHKLIAMMSGWGTPPDQLAQFEDMLITPNGKVNPQGALELAGIASGGKALPTMSTQLPSGVSGEIPAQAAQSGPGGFVPTDIPGATAAGAAGPLSSADLYKTAAHQANTFQDEIQPLKEMHRLALKVGPEGLGKGTLTANDATNFLISSGAADALGLDKQKSYDYQDLVKFTKRYAQQMSLGGTGSDAQLIQSVGGNPNVSMNQQAFLPVVRYIMAMRRMRQVAYNEYNANHMNQATGMVDTRQFGPETSTWMQNQDRRAYSFDLLNPSERENLLKSLKDPSVSDAERQRFYSSLDTARKYGLSSGRI